MESLPSVHENGFSRFGCLITEILYGCMRAVIQGEADVRKRRNATFKVFAEHWDSEPRV